MNKLHRGSMHEGSLGLQLMLLRVGLMMFIPLDFVILILYNTNSEGIFKNYRQRFLSTVNYY